jgi:hypothetical protein
MIFKAHNFLKFNQRRQIINIFELLDQLIPSVPKLDHSAKYVKILFKNNRRLFGQCWSGTLFGQSDATFS